MSPAQRMVSTRNFQSVVLVAIPALAQVDYVMFAVSKKQHREASSEMLGG